MIALIGSLHGDGVRRTIAAHSSDQSSARTVRVATPH